MKSFLRWCFLALFFTLSLSCKEKKPQLVADPISGAHLTVPRDFRVGAILPGNDSVNSRMKLQASNVFKDIGVGVTIEEKADIADKLTLDEYVEIVSKGRAAAVKNATRSERVERTVNGKRAVQETVRGAAGIGNIVYLILYVENDERFFQVTSWTQPSRLTANRPIMQGMLDSFGVEPYGSQ